MLASTDPVFVACWTTGSDPAEDGIFLLEGLGFPAAEGRVEVVTPSWFAPYRNLEAGSSASRELATLGLTGERLAELPNWETATAEHFAALESRPVVLAGGRNEFLARFRLACPTLHEPVVLDLESLASFLHPRRGERAFGGLYPRFLGSAVPARPRSADIRRLCEALIRQHFARPDSVRQVFARAFDDLQAVTEESESAAWEWLELARRMLDRPSRYAAGDDDDLFTNALADGEFERDLSEAPMDAERALTETTPAFRLEYETEFGEHAPLESRREDAVALTPEDHKILQSFYDLVPRAFAPEGAEPRDRPGQRALALEVTGALEENRFLMADAPTGTGKTLSYLAPSLLWSTATQTRVALSTYTRALQEQAYFREIPRALRLLRDAGLPDERIPRVALLKGRANYICGRAIMDTAPEAGSGSVIARATWLRLALFYAEDLSGDLDGFHGSPGLPLGQPAAVIRELWRMVASARAIPGCCHGKAAKRCGAGIRTLRAARAHLVVTNHAYMLHRPDDFGHALFDECDHLHEVALDVLSWDIELDEVVELSQTLLIGRGRDRAPLERLHKLVGQLPEGDGPERLRPASSNALKAAHELDAAAYECTRHLKEYRKYREEHGANRSKEELAFFLHEYVTSGHGEQLATALHSLRDAVDRLDSSLRTSVEELGDLPQRQARRLRWFLRKPLDRLAHWNQGLNLWLGGENEEGDFSEKLHYNAVWEQRRRPLLALKYLLPQEWLGTVYFPSLSAGVLVSATAKMRGGFKAMRGYLGVDHLVEDTLERKGREVETYAGPTTFDTRAALYCVPEDAPPYRYAGPDAEAWMAYVEEVLLFLAERTRGRILTLFTNRKLLRRVAERLSPRFRALGLPLLWQGMPGVGKEDLARQFLAHPESCLFGLDTFWYGVDFPGDTCQYIVMPKLPFGAPDDYMIAQQARMGWGPHRNSIYMPKALAMFRQGCGRLLRHEDDRGAVLLLDHRVLNKRNVDFLNELPGGQEEWDRPDVLAADTDTCLRKVFSHMQLGAELERRGLDPGFRILSS